MFCDGHCLLIGVPGLAKTLLIKTISDCLGLKFNRIQFTPDLMPSDIVGSEILDKNREFKFLKGPVFSNIILADEINRTPPKTQAALLEAMQEKSITNSGTKSPLFTKPSSPPLFAETISSEYKAARTLKSSPSYILFLKLFNLSLIDFFSS